MEEKIDVNENDRNVHEIKLFNSEDIKTKNRKKKEEKKIPEEKNDLNLNATEMREYQDGLKVSVSDLIGPDPSFPNPSFPDMTNTNIDGKTLIEHYLPVPEISKEARIEKHGRPPITLIHYWWTRKPLIVAMAAALGALLPADYPIPKYLDMLGLGRDKRAHNYDINPNQRIKNKYEYIKTWGSESPIFLDPLGGAGSIPFEAMRLGINVISNDYNPVAYLIQKATLEYPKKFGKKLVTDVEKGFDWIFNETRKDVEAFYPKYNGYSTIAYIWSWMVRCPKCGFDDPLVREWLLSEKTGTYIQPSITDGILTLEIKKGKDIPPATCTDGEGICLSCGSKIHNEVVRKDILERKEERLLAVVIKKDTVKEYVLPSKEDLDVFQILKKENANNYNNWLSENLVPFEEMPEDTRGSIPAKLYLKYWNQLLNPRQLLLFVTLLRKTKEYGKIVKNNYSPDYGEAIMTYLSFIFFSKHIDRNCRSSAWFKNESIGHVLAWRGIAMLWNHSEVNPFVKGSGSLLSTKRDVVNGLIYAVEKLATAGNVRITQKSVINLKELVDIILTDPAYFDDVRFAEFSEFFYVWERRALEGFHDLGNVPNAEEMSVGGNNRTKEFFERLFKLSCQSMYNCLKDNGIMVMFFAHSSITAWDFVIRSLTKANFRITATWPVHTESDTNPLARGNANMMSSIIIVARKRKSEKSGYIEEIKEEVDNHLKKRLSEFWGYGLRGADLTVSAMGTTLDIITQYSEIKSYTGDMNVENILKIVQKSVVEYVVGRYLPNTRLDGQTTFYLYSKLNGLGDMEFNTANLIAKSLGLNLKKFEEDGLIKSVNKEKTKGYHILKYNERVGNTPSSLIDAVHLILIAFDKAGFTEVEKELNNIPYGRAEIKNVLEALLSLPPEDPERQISQKILERMI